MISNFQVDTREFDRALKQYIATTSKTLAGAINNKAGNVANKAYANTAKVDKQQIASELGASYGRVMGKRGKLLKGNKITITGTKEQLARARALYVAQLRRLAKLDTTKDITGRLPLWIKRRVASGGFLSTGWIAAMRTFIKETGGKLLPRRAGRTYGRAIRARDGLGPFAEIENNSTPKENKASAERVMTRALSKAFAEETADMEQYLARKAQAAANTVNPPNAKP